MHSDTVIRVLIAEDEPIILNNIEKKAARAGDWVEIAGLAETGREALAILEKSPADILITDIEMPGMNGLELIRTVRSRFPHMRIIILSGYSNFEYARAALRYGVNEYLLKPVAQEALTGLLRKLRDEISGEKFDQHREILSLALNGDISAAQFPSELAEGCFYLVYLTLGNYAGAHDAPEISKDYRALWERFIPGECFGSFPELSHIWMVDEHYPLCRFAILHSTNSRLSVGRLRLFLEQYCAQVFPQRPFLCVIHAQSVSCHEIWPAGKELRRYAAANAHPFVQEALLFDGKFPDSSAESARLVQVCGLFQNFSTVPSFLQYVRKSLQDFLDSGFPGQILLKLVAEAFSAAETIFSADQTLSGNMTANIYGKFYSCPDSSAFLSEVTGSLKQLLRESGPALSGGTLCERITGYICIHYCSRLSLNDLALHFGYTASYINRIFKKELGLSPLQYITNLKIERAKELLRSESPMDIRDIAAAIGYEDARYFSRVFKNETGMTPSAFAGRSQGEEA